MIPAAYSSRSVRLVLPASTCARIPKFSVLRGKRCTPRRDGHPSTDGGEHCSHLVSLVARRPALGAVNHDPRRSTTEFPGPAEGIHYGLITRSSPCTAEPQPAGSWYDDDERVGPRRCPGPLHRPVGRME